MTQEFIAHISNGTFLKAVFGGPYPDVDLTGQTDIILQLPVDDVGGIVWNARVHYKADEGYESIVVEPKVTHKLDEIGKSFHTTGRTGADVTVVMPVPEPAPIVRPVWSEPVIDTGFVDLSWGPEQDQTAYVVEHVFEGQVQFYSTDKTSMRVITGPGYHEFKVQAVRVEEEGLWSELLGFHIKATGEDQLLTFLYDLKQIVNERIEAIEHNKSIA